MAKWTNNRVDSLDFELYYSLIPDWFIKGILGYIFKGILD